MNETSKAIHDLTKLIGHYYIQEVKLSTKDCDYYLTHLLAIVGERDAYKEALERIANQDYRGNRSAESQIAFKTLAAMRKEGGGA
jgi:hypothetical protein